MRGLSQPRPLLAVPNVTAHPLPYCYPLLCGFSVRIKGLISKTPPFYNSSYHFTRKPHHLPYVSLSPVAVSASCCVTHGITAALLGRTFLPIDFYILLISNFSTAIQQIILYKMALMTAGLWNQASRPRAGLTIVPFMPWHRASRCQGVPAATC